MNNFDIVKSSLKHYGLIEHPDSLTEETTFEELDMDSLDVVEVITDIEDKIGKEIPMTVVRKFENVGDVTNWMNSNDSN